MSVANPIKLYLVIGSVLSAVILTGCVSRSEYDKAQAENQQLQTQNQQLQTQNQQLQQEASAQSAQIDRLRGAIKYTVNSDLLFPSGSYEMSARGQQIIASFAAKLAPFQQTKIVVNGYTDNAPIGPELRRQGITSNKELSEKRAETVMQFMVSQGVKPELVAAEGYGEADPVASNDTAQGRSQNRRVELTLTAAGS
jgi:chemotaxis protein MotB